MDSRLRIGEQLTKKKTPHEENGWKRNKSEGQAEMRERKENKRGSSRKEGGGGRKQRSN